jgi:hypothetical protein
MAPQLNHGKYLPVLKLSYHSTLYNLGTESVVSRTNTDCPKYIKRNRSNTSILSYVHSNINKNIIKKSNVI